MLPGKPTWDDGRLGQMWSEDQEDLCYHRDMKMMISKNFSELKPFYEFYYL